MRRICLCMIVKDEAAVIERCLSSVRGLIDSWVICDTGSSDGTQALIEKALEGVPGALYERPWRNFGENRTEALRLASGKGDYLLLIDADMTVTFEREGLERLTADAYMVRHEEPLEYRIKPARAKRSGLALRGRDPRVFDDGRTRDGREPRRGRDPPPRRQRYAGREVRA